MTEEANLRLLSGKARGGIQLIEDISPIPGAIQGRVDNGERFHFSGERKRA